MSMPVEVTLTDEQAARMKRAIAGRRALGAASSVVSSVRTSVLGSFTGEAGVEVRQERTPLLTGLTDDADAVFVQLCDWATYWSEQIGADGPTVDAMWMRNGEVLGFRAGMTATEVAGIVTKVVRWLLLWDSTIDRHDAAEEYYRDVAAIVWGLQARARISDRRRPAPSPRPCPVCGELEVRGEFFGESMTAAEARGEVLIEDLVQVRVRCAHCGHEVTASETEKLRWLR